MPPAAINWCASSVALRAFAWRLNAATAGLPLTPLRSFWMYSECCRVPPPPRGGLGGFRVFEPTRVLLTAWSDLAKDLSVAQ
jgi:hypothetical protein